MKRFLLLLLLLLTGCGSDPIPERSFSHAAYVWNYQWTVAVTSSVARAKTLGLDRLDVFCGELGGSGHAAPDWTAASRAGLPVVPVLRVFARRSGDIETRPEALAADVSKNPARRPRRRARGRLHDRRCATRPRLPRAPARRLRRLAAHAPRRAPRRAAGRDRPPVPHGPHQGLPPARGRRR